MIHIANTLLVFALLRRMTGRPGRGAFVAAIFAAHPLHVESVAWIAERKDVLSTFFWMLTALAYVGYVRRPGWARYLAMLVLYALALMSKPMVVTLPVVLLLLDLWPLRRNAPWTRLVVEKVPLLALALATSIATVIVQNRVGAMAGLDALSWQVRAANATIGYVAYLSKTLWPTRLAAFYPLFAISPGRVAGAATALAAVTAAVFACRAKYPYLFVGWLWYVITIAPVIGLLQAGEQGGRSLHARPMFGILGIVAWGVPALLERRRIQGSWAMAGALAIVVACAITARAQAAHWEDSVTLWEHAVRVTPESYIAHENLGQALRERGRMDEAKASYERALVHAPARSPGYLAVIENSLGMVLTRQGRSAEALEHFDAAARLNPAFAEAQSNLANALAADGRLADATVHYQEAVRLKPDSPSRASVLRACSSARDGREAIPHYREGASPRSEPRAGHNGSAATHPGPRRSAMAEYQALRLGGSPTAHSTSRCC